MQRDEGSITNTDEPSRWSIEVEDHEDEERHEDTGEHDGGDAPPEHRGVHGEERERRRTVPGTRLLSAETRTVCRLMTSFNEST
jgi:hypothetical protein